MARVRPRTWAFILIFAWIIPWASAFWSMGTFVRAQSSLPLIFNENNAYLGTQDQMSFGNRTPGTPPHNECADYFKSSLAPYAMIFEQNFTLHGISCQNVYGILNPTITNSIVILGAHYDSRAKADEDVPYTGQVCPGANDGAAGCAVLLELARVFYQIRSKLNVQIWFVFFDVEDQGYGTMQGMPGFGWAEGSYWFASNLESLLGPLPLSTIKLMILLDMVGGTGLQFAKDGLSDSEVQDLFFQLGRDLGYTTAFPTNPHYFSSSLIDDHKWFVQRGITSVDLLIDFTAWPYHHTSQDTMAHISAESLGITGTTVEKFFHEYYVSAANGGGGRDPFWGQGWDWLLTEGGAILVSCIFGACMVLGMFLAFKAYVMKKREVLKDQSINRESTTRGTNA